MKSIEDIKNALACCRYDLAQNTKWLKWDRNHPYFKRSSMSFEECRHEWERQSNNDRITIETLEWVLDLYDKECSWGCCLDTIIENLIKRDKNDY